MITTSRLASIEAFSPSWREPASWKSEPGEGTHALARLARALSARRDLDFQVGAHFGVQPNCDLVRADRLDRVLDLDLASVELGAASRLDGGSDVGRRDRAEKTAAAARPRQQSDANSRQPAGCFLGVVEAADLA